MKRKTILIVEDEQANFMYLQELLKDFDFNVIHAKDGQLAINSFSDNNLIDLILMDIKMPVMDGIEATKTIRKINPTIPIIAQTAYTMANDKINALNAGCNDFISKPISKKMLVDIFEKYL